MMIIHALLNQSQYRINRSLPSMINKKVFNIVLTKEMPFSHSKKYFVFFSTDFVVPTCSGTDCRNLGFVVSNGFHTF